MDSSRFDASVVGPRSRVWVVGLCLFGLYMLSPALTSTHVEGFTAALQLDAIAAQQHLIDRADLLHPVQTEYLYLTRQGVVLLLRGLMALTGGDGDALFRGLTAASLVTFLLASAVVARRHAGLGWGAALASLLLLPGLFELGFHFNDSVVAAAFGVGALALLPPPATGGLAAASWLRALAVGMALAMAALCRADALLLLPLALALAACTPRRAGEWAVLCAAAAVGMLLTFALAQAVSGTTLLQALRVAHFFDTVHATVRITWVRVLAFVLFFSLPGIAFVAIGAVRTWRAESTWRRRLALLVLPALVVAYALRSATEVRQIYPYTAPFVVMFCGRGLQWAAAALRGGGVGRRPALALLVATAVVWLLPPIFVPVKDGPRAVLGRAWSPPMWRAWQARVDASLDDVDALLARAEGAPRTAVISAHYNSDHYLQLRAWQRRWLPLRVDETADRCGGGVEVWRKGSHALVLVRLDNTYGLSQIDHNDYAAVHLREALPCPALHGVPAFVSDFWPPLSTEAAGRLLLEHMPPTPAAAVSFGWPVAAVSRLQTAWGGRDFLAPLTYGVNRTAPLDAQQLTRLGDLAEQQIARTLQRTGAASFPDMAQLLPRFGNRYWTPPPSPHAPLSPPPASPPRHAGAGGVAGGGD